MKKNRIKNSIYRRVFAMFFATYLLLMIAFSAFLVYEEKKAVEIEVASNSTLISGRVVENLEGNIDHNKQITNISEVKIAFVNNPLNIFISEDLEFALFTGDYKLIYNSNDYWISSFSEIDEENESIGHVNYGLLNPYEWFSQEEVKELEDYLYANPKVEKAGDLDGYSLDIYGFWMKDEMIIPNEIYITPMYASSLDEDGNVTGSSGSRRDDLVYRSGFENTEGLPYYEIAAIYPEFNKPNYEVQEELRKMVVDQSNIERLTEEYSGLPVYSERASGLTYHYYMLVPYGSLIDIRDDGSLYSDFWTALAVDINIGERISSTLIYVWTACLLIFFIAAYILSRQTYQTYLKQEELERKRKEMTDGLAHDLKTPLSIISGYAQNLQENVHTEKRDYYTSHINKNVKRMDMIIGKMLEMGRLESDSFELKLEQVSLGQLSNEIINRYKELCQEKSISISLEGDTEIKADKSLIDRVIDNFIINAIENTPEDGRIRINIIDDRFEVYNSGSHISDDKIKEIWHPYKKVEAERSNTKGTGLGLSISRTILELHGFSYAAINNEDGVTFWFMY